MNWFNQIGMILVALLLLPNILYAIRRKNEENNQKKIILQIFEQIGRYGVMLFMIFNIPYTYLFENNFTDFRTDWKIWCHAFYDF